MKHVYALRILKKKNPEPNHLRLYKTLEAAKDSANFITCELLEWELLLSDLVWKAYSEDGDCYTIEKSEVHS